MGGAPDAEPIAVIGMSGRFPQAADLQAFWRNLEGGRDCIEEVPASRWDWREVWGDPATQDNKTNIKWGGFIEGVDEFDPLFFGISPKEAEVMDPQQRLLMMYVWKAIEDAGYAPSSGRRTPNSPCTPYAPTGCRRNGHAHGAAPTGPAGCGWPAGPHAHGGAGGSGAAAAAAAAAISAAVAAETEVKEGMGAFIPPH